MSAPGQSRGVVATPTSTAGSEPTGYQAFRYGHGWFRPSDLSRVKKHGREAVSPVVARFFGRFSLIDPPADRGRWGQISGDTDSRTRLLSDPGRRHGGGPGELLVFALLATAPPAWSGAAAFTRPGTSPRTWIRALSACHVRTPTGAGVSRRQVLGASSLGRARASRPAASR
jgi:hypothetical protein